MKTRLSAALTLILLSGIAGQDVLAQKGSRSIRYVFYVLDLSTGDHAQITNGQVIVTAGSDTYIGLIGGRHAKAVVELPSSVTSVTVTVDAPGFCGAPETFTNLSSFCKNCLQVEVSPCSP